MNIELNGLMEDGPEGREIKGRGGEGGGGVPVFVFVPFCGVLKGIGLQGFMYSEQ